MKIRILGILLALVMLLTGCAGVFEKESSSDADEDTKNEVSITETDSAENVEYISLVEDGKAKFVIVCEEGSFVTIAETLKSGLSGKSGVLFSLCRYVKSDETRNKIYVGKSYNEVMESEPPKLYGTYGVVVKGSDLYVCADTQSGLRRCITEFLASITDDMIVKGENGKTELAISEELLFLNEPTPDEVKGVLLGTPLSDFRIVISEKATEAEKYYAQTLIEKIRKQTYKEIPIVTDTERDTNWEIVLGNTTRTGSAVFYESDPVPYTYSLESKGKDLYIGYSDVYSLGDALSEFYTLMNGNHDSVSIEGCSKKGLRVEKDRESDVRIVTANVLYVGYDSEDPNKTVYKSRMELTARYFNMYDADFIGVQECPTIMRNAMNPYLDEKYKWVEIDTSNTNTDYFPILYNAEKWQVEVSGAAERTVSQTERPWGYVWTTFVRKDNPNEKYTMVNLHYTLADFADRGAGWSEYRVPLAQAVNTFVKDQLRVNPTVPVVVTGDYNGGPGSDVYEAQIDGIEMDSTYHIAKDNNAGDSIDNICVTTELVDVVAHRVNIDEKRNIMSDHAYHYADIRLKSVNNS